MQAPSQSTLQSPISIALDAKLLHHRGATMTAQVGLDTKVGTASMSGDERRSAGHRPQATALILDSTSTAMPPQITSMAGRWGTADSDLRPRKQGADCRP